MHILPGELTDLAAAPTGSQQKQDQCIIPHPSYGLLVDFCQGCCNLVSEEWASRDIVLDLPSLNLLNRVLHSQQSSLFGESIETTDDGQAVVVGSRTNTLLELFFLLS